MAGNKKISYTDKGRNITLSVQRRRERFQVTKTKVRIRIAARLGQLRRKRKLGRGLNYYIQNKKTFESKSLVGPIQEGHKLAYEGRLRRTAGNLRKNYEVKGGENLLNNRTGQIGMWGLDCKRETPGKELKINRKRGPFRTEVGGTMGRTRTGGGEGR